MHSVKENFGTSFTRAPGDTDTIHAPELLRGVDMGSRRAKLVQRADVRFVWTDLFSSLLGPSVDGGVKEIAHGVHGHLR